jgi:hypothetical protein
VNAKLKTGLDLDPLALRTFVCTFNQTDLVSFLPQLPLDLILANLYYHVNSDSRTLKFAWEVLSRVEQLYHSQVLATSPSGTTSESSLQWITILPDVTTTVMHTLNQRFQFLINDANLSTYLEMVWLLLRLGANGIVNFGLVSQKSSEEINRSLNSSASLGAIFKFISDFLAHYITDYFLDKKCETPLLFTIHVAASILLSFHNLQKIL